ncbi:nucleotidyltransferase family protein [Geminocystis sp. CENA526]|uniref:nucleotidyltransferase family protein n=1 Tax=Geminocystis sp. CENA526 TaxID=1355871 RepID=UPI003D6E2BE3
MMTTLIKDKIDIFQELQKHQKTLESYGVKRCGLFGSFRRGEATENSDIDLLVEFHPELKTFVNFMDLCFFLRIYLGEKSIFIITVEEP